MDETDLRLFQLLSADSRRTYRDLADRLGLTVQAVHRRIRALEDGGAIQRYTAHLSVAQLGAVPVYFSGRSGAGSPETVLENLKADDSVELVITSGDNVLFIRSILRGLADLEPHIDFIRKAAALSDPFPMGLEGITQVGDRAAARAPGKAVDLATVDYRIINELHRDSRTATADIARALGLSAKTVARRLARLVSEEAIEFRVVGQLGAAQGSTGMIVITLRSGADKTAFRKYLKDEFGVRLMAAMTYPNLQDTVLCIAWAPTNAGLSEMAGSIMRSGYAAGATTHVIYKHYQFDTWRDNLVAEKARKG